jgi:hypothetical protein
MSKIKEHVEKRMAELFNKDSIDSMIDTILEKRITVLVNMHLAVALGVEIKRENEEGLAELTLSWNSPLSKRVDSYVEEFFELYLSKKVEEISSRLSSDESILKIQKSLDSAIESCFEHEINGLIAAKSREAGRDKAREMMEETLRKMTGLGKNRTSGVIKKAIPD